ncbi:MAG: hypothetical protein M1553_01825 [Firmicutes bacterium]|nr:hypothetical protein [Bacillota bacterium]
MPYLNLKPMISFLGLRLMREKESGRLFFRFGNGSLRRLGCKREGSPTLQRKKNI